MNYDIIICGLGPTGAVLANLLAMKNISVLVIEKDTDIYYAPRAVHFDDEVMRVFQAGGLADSILATSEPFKQMEIMLKPEGKPFFSANIGSQDYRYGYNGAFWFHQPTLERNIHAGLERFAHVKIIYGAEIITVSQNSDSVSIIAKYEDEKTIEASGKYLIGCDGGKSFVRKMAGIELDSANFDEPWVVVDTKTKSGLKDENLPINHRQYCNPNQPVTYVPLTTPYYEWQFMVVDGKNEQQVTEPFYVREKLKPFVDLNTIEIIRIAYYKFHALWARNWYKGRIILAGDSAHQMPPFLGQGMCSGVRDASALAWRLNLILKGKADESLLHSYQEERLKHVKHIINGAMFFGRIIQTKQKWKAILRNIFLFFPVAKLPFVKQIFLHFANRKRPLETGLIGKNKPKIAGNLLIQPNIKESNGKNTLLHKVLGYDFSVLARKGIIEKNRQYFQRISPLTCTYIEFDKKSAPLTVGDEKGILQTWFDAQNIDFVIVRPDQYVFDAGKESDIPAVVASLLLHFNPTSPQ